VRPGSLWSALLVGALLCGACSTKEPDKNNQMSNPAKPVSIESSAPPSPALQPALSVPGSGMYAVLLGTGTPVPDPDRQGPATAIVVGGQSYIVDFGPGVVRRASAAHSMGIEALDVRRLNLAFATHLHSDHTAGYPDLILSPAVVGRRTPLEVYGPTGITSMTNHILQAYAEDLGVRRSKNPISAMRGYQVNPHEIAAGEIYKDKNVVVEAFPVSHGTWGNAFGFRFQSAKKVIVISGDTSPNANTISACSGCDILIHEVYCKAGFDRGPKSWQQYHATFHTSTKQLAELATKARPRLLVLYHHLLFGCTEEQLLREVTEDYDGEVVFGHDLDIY
jgi:ribonuclease BN (tRNA processing enzyme)